MYVCDFLTWQFYFLLSLACREEKKLIPLLCATKGFLLARIKHSTRAINVAATELWIITFLQWFFFASNGMHVATSHYIKYATTMTHLALDEDSLSNKLNKFLWNLIFILYLYFSMVYLLRFIPTIMSTKAESLTTMHR